MALVRGSNPIWYEVDLTAHAFDDTFYLFVLDNEIPYAPLPTWQDPFGNVEWTSPIQFLANGTLPNNIYYDPDVVYRLEFRQGPTQQDPLIYLVENYVPGSSGNTPIDETSFSTDNQISNPQFALINFTSPLTLTSISTQVINVAPDWFLNLTGTGTVTLKQVTLNSAVVNPTNASYALQIVLSGSWTKAYLSQRFTQNGVLWSNTYISSSISALSGNAPQNISMSIVDSQGNTRTPISPNPILTNSFNEYLGLGQIGNSADTDFPPTAYIEYQILLPNTCDITLTSVQIISGDIPVEYPYEQTTIERQIDHTYHNAYPIVPVGAVIDFAGFAIPEHYLLCDGTAISRLTYDLLFQALTEVETVTLTNGSPTFTVISSTDFYIGMILESTGIPGGTTISNIVGTTITMSANATVDGATAVTFFATGEGDGSTTFNVPNLQDFVVAGVGGSLFGAGNNGVGASGGSATETLTSPNQLPSHTHPSDSGAGFIQAGGSVSLSSSAGSSESVAANTGATGSSSPFSIVQQTYLMKKCIRFE